MRSAALRLLSEAPRKQTLLLFALMLLARLTEGIGLVLLVPLLETVSTTSEPSALSQKILQILEFFGLPASLGALLIAFVMLVALRAVLLFAQQYLSMQYQFAVIDNMRKRLFGQLLRAEWRWLVNQRSSDLVNLLTNNIGRIGTALNQLIALVAGVTTLVAYCAAAVLLSWQVALVSLFAGAVAYALFSRNRRRAVELGQSLTGKSRILQARVQEGLSAIRLTKLRRAEERHEQDFSAVVEQLRGKQMAYALSSGLGNMSLEVGGAAMLAALLYFGFSWASLPMSIMLTMVLIFVRLLPVFASTQQSYHHWLHAKAALEEYDAKLAECQNIAEPISGINAPSLPLTRAITCDKLGFAYAGSSTQVLQNLSAEIPANQTTAITGASGSGKSSFADLLTGLLQPDSGQILIDDTPLDADNRLRWRQSVAYVEQDSFLFHDSIVANLKWAHPDATLADMENALRLAAAEFVFALPDGLDTIVGDAGQKLSGGERQRIALARALLAKPELLVLDEATSALDLENEALVHRALANMRGQMTIVLIGHRLSGLGIADRNLHVENGRVQVRTLERVTA